MPTLHLHTALCATLIGALLLGVNNSSAARAAPAVAGATTSAAAAASRNALWASPLGGALEISAFYDLPNGPYRAGHRGIDLPSSEGATATAPTAGVVSFSGVVVDRPVLSIRVDERTVLSLEPLSSTLSPGDVIARGQELGEVASGGHCTSECLHLGVRVSGTYVNPLRYFRARPVLLPW